MRYERSRPGSLVHMDINKLARIERPGHRIDGDRSETVRGAGWEYYHAAVDYASRVACGAVLPGERKEDAGAFLLRVVAFFGCQGVKISQLMTDNGAATGRNGSGGRSASSESATSSPVGTRPGPTARWSASSAPRLRRGLRPVPSTRASGPRCSASGSAIRHAAIGRLTLMQRLVDLRPPTSRFQESNQHRMDRATPRRALHLRQPAAPASESGGVRILCFRLHPTHGEIAEETQDELHGDVA